MAGENGILIVAETGADGSLGSITNELMSAAQGLSADLGEPISAALIGSGVGDRAQDIIDLGADTVYLVDGEQFANYLNETYTPAVIAIAQQANPRIILIGHTPNGRDLGPYLAVRLQTGIASDTSGLSIEGGQLQAARSVAGGLFRQVVSFPKMPAIATVHMKAYDGAEPQSGRSGNVVNVDVGLDASSVRSRFVKHEDAQVEGIRMEDATIVVTGGRGMGDEAGFNELYKLQALLPQSAVGATRAATDSGFCEQDLMIGITGRVVSPDVYFAIALSGASQHMAGCSGSKNIVAINRDPEANIFSESRFGVVGDYKQVLPALIEEVEKLMQG
ncbi:MAG: electron transfer flavoprotein subunit alpha/FixB family protein [Dehalococcoidia bacterium]|nr:electron transfer flavoprotein subunit alpha/FixB family protein [Dehalococcoidia bacterium]